jgi:hypothetical protein
VKRERGERVTAEPDAPPPAPHEDLLNRNISRRYETPRRYETRVEVERSPAGRIRAERD